MLKEPWRSILVALLTAVITILGGVGVTQVSGCGTVIPPPNTDPDKPPDTGRVDAWNAIGKVAMSGSYCSGTVIGPRREDGRYTIVSAAHCFRQVGQTATFIQREGTTRTVTCIAIDRRADIALLRTETGQGDMAYTLVADKTPAWGVKVWHGGYGRDKPGNKEAGSVVSGPNQDNQVEYHISVSPGDSGGGIVADANGHLLSPVCCTTNLDGLGRVWGGSPEKIRQMLATPTDYIDLPPHEMPAPPAHAIAEEPKK